MKYAFFPGCSIPIKYPGFEAATRLVCERLGIELVGMDFSCCPPASSVKQVHYGSWLALAARNLCVAEEAGLDILTLCSGCVNTLKEANDILKERDNKRRRVNQILETVNHEFKGTIEVTHILDVLDQEPVKERILKERSREIPLRVGSHYGCHYFRPSAVMDPRELEEGDFPLPVKMDHVLSLIGAEPVDYARKYLCCGMPLGANMDADAGYSLTREKLSHMRDSDVQALAVICPSCFEQFDLGQVMLRRKYKEKDHIPTFYLTQLLGLSMGMTSKELGLDMHRVKSKKLLKSINVK
jgi:heterodisulfide reductase subunit B2